MCATADAEETDYGIRVHTGRFSSAYLQKRAKVRGHVVVSWNGRHVAEPIELTDGEATGFWLDVLEIARAVEGHYRPLKLNIELLGNSTPHLHAHVRPRCVDDGSPMGPLPHEGARAFPDDKLRADARALEARLRK